MKACAMGRGYTTCAECDEFTDFRECKKINNLISKFFSLIFGTDRIGNLERIREEGLPAFKEEATDGGNM
jgi:hypothetical protein